MLGASESKIKTVIQQYNKFGIEWRTYGKWGGRREKRCLLSLDEEKKILSELESLALEGKILTFRHVKGFVESKVGSEVSDDYVWDMFNRHN